MVCEKPCGVPIPATDFINAIAIGSEPQTVDFSACVAACAALPTCNVATRIDIDGSCAFKRVDPAIAETVSGPSIVTTQLLCEAGEICGGFVPNTDIPGDNLAAQAVLNEDVCLTICEQTEGCNAFVWRPFTNGCFLKSVDVNAVAPINRGGFTSFVVCDKPDTAPAPIPVCGEQLPQSDIVGRVVGSIAATPSQLECDLACLGNPECNAVVRIDATGDCFLKNVGDANIQIEPFPIGTAKFFFCREDSVPECRSVQEGFDIVGDNIGAVPDTADINACIASCEGLPGCKAAIRINANGACFLKSVDQFSAAFVEFPSGTSVLVCDPPPEL